MNVVLRRWVLIVASFLSLFPPAVGAYLRWGGWPPGFGVFPPQVPTDAQGVPMVTPGFSPIYFALGCIVACVILAFLLFPQWFGFKESAPVHRQRQRVAPPWWMYVGLVVTGVCWWMMWFSTSEVVKYLFTPLWWGFISVIDGIVYARTGGASMFAKLPRQLLLTTVGSIAAWYFFEWLNYFVLEDWVYPNSPSIFTEPQARFWFSLTYTCVWPAIFEWYTLLRTFPALESRWSDGPRISLSKPMLMLALLAGTALGVMVGVLPYLLFFAVWLGSLLILPAVMGLLGFWTPLTSIARGNWSPMTLIALAGLANGFFWEFWNHGSNVFLPGRNPNYWVYDIPYVNVIHVFSEMPLLGYFGYLPFGVQSWVWWLVLAHVLKLNPDFDPEHVGLPGEVIKKPSMPPPAKMPSIPPGMVPGE